MVEGVQGDRLVREREGGVPSPIIVREDCRPDQSPQDGAWDPGLQQSEGPRGKMAMSLG